jgi:hypothetical protein
MDPPAVDGRVCARARGGGHAPLWQYFARVEKADEPMCAPKGHLPRTPATFPLQISRFQGTAEGP